MGDKGIDKGIKPKRLKDGMRTLRESFVKPAGCTCQFPNELFDTETRHAPTCAIEKRLREAK